MALGRYQLGSFFLGLKVSQHTFHCIIIRVKFMRYDCFEYTKKNGLCPYFDSLHSHASKRFP